MNDTIDKLHRTTSWLRRELDVTKKLKVNQDNFSKFRIQSTKYRLLDLHLSTRFENSSNESGGHRNPEELTYFYLDFHQCSQFIKSLFHKYFGLPCSKTWNRKHKQYLDTSFINDNIFDGSIHNIKQIFDLFLDSTTNTSMVCKLMLLSIHM